MKATLTPLQSQQREARFRPLICLIPGGPGMTSATLRSMDILSRSFDLTYVDTPDANREEPTFSGVVDAIERELVSLKRSVVLLGHSFGGLLAIELADRGTLQLSGLVVASQQLDDTFREVIPT